MRNPYVHCPACGEDHFTDEVEFVNIEESLEGWDRMTFICPLTGDSAAAIVRSC